jgi:hypothetical protein
MDKPHELKMTGSKEVWQVEVATPSQIITIELEDERGDPKFTFGDISRSSYIQAPDGWWYPPSAVVRMRRIS